MKSISFLLGHSWGGMLAIEYALKYQETYFTGLIRFIREVDQGKFNN